MSHCGVKGYDIQDISIIERLIREEACSFFTYDRETKRECIYKNIPGWNNISYNQSQ